jgi:hypothetical protein
MNHVQTLEIERYGSRKEVEAAEKHVIRTENPVFNVALTPRNRDRLPCHICKRTEACGAMNCPKRKFQMVPIIQGKDIRCMC